MLLLLLSLYCTDLFSCKAASVFTINLLTYLLGSDVIEEARASSFLEPGGTPWSVQVLTRNSSGDEMANVNFLYDIVYVLQNTIDSCINCTTDRRGYVLKRMFTKFSEITQYNGHYAVQNHSRSPILVPIESSCTTSY